VNCAAGLALANRGQTLGVFAIFDYTNLTSESLTRLRGFRYSGCSIVAGVAIEGVLERAMRSFYYCFAFTYRFRFTGSGPAKRARMI
jgi:hypothetical protein